MEGIAALISNPLPASPKCVDKTNFRKAVSTHLGEVAKPVRVGRAVERLMRNLGAEVLPFALCSQYVGEPGLSAEDVIRLKIRRVLDNYRAACERGG